ncbi:phosphate acetyltransferase [Desulfobacter hydrogenophilus]|uniref:Phosphate acetyltransferase n=1 Tax=Desulfobacter hydrogenophilus TaxID=2291 RepID=A0A328F768_9BACT|nr:phosphate acetyltransferase [Desulfobacter hydrogenophilus]NDY74260.1 phosphate acetyltransferase [Desulfobacter hydrogenophilus]QBH14592.1 phosphate acetyltransferase [Desulfobacter hydrogenophilus]RAM00421.1 phosphate acetyltransferase [Desulfobacter hydrogenophilus]
MANSLYITTTETRSGKSLIVLGIMQLLLKDIRIVGFFRPIINPSKKDTRDHDIDLVLSNFNMGLEYEETYAYTLEEAKQMVNSGRQAEMMKTILNKYKALEEKSRFVLCEGTDFTAGSEAFEFDINAGIIADIGCPALVVSYGYEKNVEQVITSCQLALESLYHKGVDVLAIMVNRVPPDSLHSLKIALNTAIDRPEVLIYTIPETQALRRPSFRDLIPAMDAQVLYGRQGLENQISGCVIASMLVPNFLTHIKKDDLVVTSGDRSSIVITCIASRLSMAYPDIAGILVTGGIPIPDSIIRLIRGWKELPVPILLTRMDTHTAVMAIDQIHGRISPDDPQRIALALGIFEANVDAASFRQRLAARKSVRITPQMFEYSLIEKAKKNRRHIVLPEGGSDRILKAADILLRRSFCDITILGKCEAVERRIKELGLNLSQARFIQPDAAPWLDDYAQTYFELRQHKGVTLDMARDTMTDPSYFGTMMVHKGHADGMVSGSVNTTAHTILPAFQIIKTLPGSSIVSSVFLMCLKDRVLVFGDCAVNPNPTASQLAEIAVTSAGTASIFGIEPRVAMLSYSTGSSGTGADVDKVIQATAMVREKAPDLLIEGPIQYDAAIDPGVAMTKLPNSQVAGRATVFIFPDLNTGNNTYKAVQRASEKTVVIGPVLQGMKRPVNDLSRGCTVADIVNTVAITAIQAQAGKSQI